MVNIKEKLNEYITFTEENLRKYNSHSESMTAQKNLIDAMNYSLEAGGKRIRPVLVYAFCNALGGDYRKAAAPAAAGQARGLEQARLSSSGCADPGRLCALAL